MSDTDFELRFAAVTREAQASIQALARVVGDLNGNTDRTTQSLAAGKSAAIGFFEAIKVGTGIDIGGRLVAGLAQIPGILVQAGKDGVAFNATLEKSRLSIASLLATFQPEKFRTVGAALGAAGDAVEQLRQRAAESPASFESLLAGFQSLSGPSFRAGIALEKQVELTLMLSQALATLGLSAEQLPQEARAILNGDANNPDAQLARTLQINNAEIQRAKNTGTVFEYITSRLAAFKEGSDLASRSYSVLASNLGDNLQQLKGIGTAGIFEDLRKGLEILNRYLSSDSAKAGAKALSTFYGDAVAGLKGFQDTGIVKFLSNYSPAALPAKFYREAAQEEIIRQKEAQEIARLRDAVLASKTQTDFLLATRAITIAPYAKGSDNPNDFGAPLSDGAKAKLILLQREFKTLADVEKFRADEAARTAEQRERELETATKMATLGLTEEEKAKGLSELIRLQGLETSKIEGVDNARLGIITRQIQAIQGTTTALQQSGEALRPLVGGADQIKKVFEQLPSYLRQLQQQTQAGQERLADAVLGGDQRGRLALLDRQISRTKAQLDAMIRSGELPLPTFSDPDPLPSNGPTGSLFARPRNRGRLSTIPPTPINEPPLNAPALEDAVTSAAAQAAARSEAFKEALQQVIRDNIAKVRSDPGLGKKLGDEEKLLLDGILAKQAELLDLQTKRVGQGRAVNDQKKEESDIARQIATANAKERDDNEYLLRLKREQLVAEYTARETKAGGDRAANAAATARAQADAEIRAEQAEFNRRFAFTELENARQVIAAKRQLADGDRTQLRALNQEEIRVLTQLIEKWRAYNRAKEGSSAPEDRETVSSNKVAISQAEASLRQLQQQNDRSSPIGSARGAAQDFFRSIGDESRLAADLVSGTLTSAFNGVGNIVNALITDISKLGPSFAQAGLQLLVTLAQLIVKFLLLQALVLSLNAIGSLFGNPGLGTQLLAAVSKLPGKRDGGAIKGYAGGGWIGALLPFMGGPPNSDDTVPIWAQEDEFVVNRRAARRYGPLLEAINNFQLPIDMPAAFAGGGAVGGFGGGGGFRGRGGGGVILVDDRNVAARLREDPRHSRDQVMSVSRLLDERGLTR